MSQTCLGEGFLRRISRLESLNPRGSVLECASPLALWVCLRSAGRGKSARGLRGLAHSKTWRFMGSRHSVSIAHWDHEPRRIFDLTAAQSVCHDRRLMVRECRMARRHRSACGRPELPTQHVPAGTIQYHKTERDSNSTLGIGSRCGRATDKARSSPKAESGRGPPHSKGFALSKARGCAARSWSAAALCRFSYPRRVEHNG
jgi:hypothetical protein